MATTRPRLIVTVTLVSSNVEVLRASLYWTLAWSLSKPGLCEARDAGDFRPFTDEQAVQCATDRAVMIAMSTVGCFGSFSPRRQDVVIDANCSQHSVGGALIDAQSCLRSQIGTAPSDAVVLQGAAHPVVGHRTVL